MIFLFPGLVRTPAYYRGTPYRVYCPAGVGERRGESTEPDVQALVRDALEFISNATVEAVIGHSWGCHGARWLCAGHLPGVPLIEVDPRLVQVDQTKALRDLESYPDGFESKDALVAAYAEYGMTGEQVTWSSWVEMPDGRYEFAFSKEVLRGWLGGRYPAPSDAWRAIRAVGGPKPVLIRTGKFSLNSDSDWRAAEESGLVRVMTAPGMEHDVRESQQPELVRLIGEVLAERA